MPPVPEYLMERWMNRIRSIEGQTRCGLTEGKKAAAYPLNRISVTRDVFVFWTSYEGNKNGILHVREESVSGC